MSPIKPTLSDRRRAPKARLALSGAFAPRGGSNAHQGAPVALRPLDRASSEIGSMPINALAIALALVAGLSAADCSLDL